MGWTFSVQPQPTFWHNGVAQVHANGNNVAWKCHVCSHPVLFVYQRGG